MFNFNIKENFNYPSCMLLVQVQLFRMCPSLCVICRCHLKKKTKNGEMVVNEGVIKVGNAEIEGIKIILKSVKRE